MTSDALFVHHYPMAQESQAAHGLADFTKPFGLPAQIHTDNAKVETLGRWREFIRENWVKATTTEPHSPWQNRAEHEFGAVRIHSRVLMEVTG